MHPVARYTFHDFFPNLRASAARPLQICRLTGTLALAAVVFNLTGCASPAPISAEEAAAPPRVNLAPGDVVRLSFTGAPEMSQGQKIRADGKLSLPHIGEVHAAGKTIPQLRQDLIALYKSQLINSDVVVTLESGTTQVYISGSVNKPGKYVFDRPTTILQALTEAGGINQFGNSRRVQIIRLRGGQERTEVVDLRPTLGGKTTRPFYVRDGDVIAVPQTAF
jgi:polysaccharide export outer membrane protein